MENCSFLPAIGGVDPVIDFADLLHYCVGPLPLGLKLCRRCWQEDEDLVSWVEGAFPYSLVIPCLLLSLRCLLVFAYFLRHGLEAVPHHHDVSYDVLIAAPPCTPRLFEDVERFPYISAIEQFKRRKTGTLLWHLSICEQ